MRNRIPLSLIAATGIALLGAGCSPSDSPVSLDKYQTQAQDTGLSTPPPQTDTSTAPDQTASAPQDSTPTSSADLSASSTSVAPSSTSMATNEPLAFPGILPTTELSNKYIHIKTDKGTITFELLPSDGPRAASNFYYLVNHKFYDGLTFHRVENWVVQGGDPLGTGTGGPGYQFEDDPVHTAYTRGIVAMANAGPNTNGSQFFILTKDTPLPPSYSIFGRVTSGMDVVDKIAIGDKMTSVTIDSHK